MITPFGQSSTNHSVLYVDGVLTVIGQPDVPEVAAAVGFDPQAVAAGYSDLSWPLQRLPALRYVTDKDKVHGDDSASTIRLATGGLNVDR